jgi:mannitol/fructose-specific phosphotransferase system IIA component (Ntr-type)
MYGTLSPSALDSSLYIPEMRCRRKDSALAELVHCAERAGIVRRPDALRLILAHRESLGATSPGRGFAIPAARSLAISESRVVLGRSRRGIDWGAADGEEVHVVALLLSPAECPATAHAEAVLQLAAALRLQRHRQRVLDAASFDDIAAVLREALP